jgi:hypothetical protein
MQVVHIPAKANRGRVALSANHTTSFLRVSGFRLRSILSEAVGWHETPALRL